MNPDRLTQITDRVIAHIIRVLPRSYRPPALQSDTSIRDLPIDSLAVFVLLQSLENEFDVNIAARLEEYQDVFTIRNLVDLITSRADS